MAIRLLCYVYTIASLLHKLSMAIYSVYGQVSLTQSVPKICLHFGMQRQRNRIPFSVITGHQQYTLCAL